MKALCFDANVNPKKVFPHNLRHLFARVFYTIEKDIAKLADILGHSSINTTRIYIVSTGLEHRRRLPSVRTACPRAFAQSLQAGAPGETVVLIIDIISFIFFYRRVRESLNGLRFIYLVH